MQSVQNHLNERIPLKSGLPEWLVHLIFWGIYFFYPFLLFGNYPCFEFKYNQQLLGLLFQVSAVYMIYLWLFPKLIGNKKHRIQQWFYGFLGGICVVILAGLDCHINHLITGCDCNLRSCIFEELIHYIFLIGVFTSFRFFKIFQEKEKLIESTKKEKYLAELESLKAQINPHFLLNTLNAIYAHTIVENVSSKISDSIFQFSEILKYTTYEGQQHHVSLSREIQHIENYINLQLLRLENKVTVVFEKKNINEKLLIAPLLLITFVENAFKYSSDIKGNNHSIIIRLNVVKNTLYFYCHNPYNSATILSKTQSGIGLTNTLRRLELIYPEKHEISLDNNLDIFIVTLQIDLS